MARGHEGRLGALSGLGRGRPLQHSILSANFDLIRQHRERLEAQSSVITGPPDQEKVETVVSNVSRLPMIEVIEVPVVSANRAA